MSHWTTSGRNRLKDHQSRTLLNHHRGGGRRGQQHRPAAVMAMHFFDPGGGAEGGGGGSGGGADGGERDRRTTQPRRGGRACGLHVGCSAAVDPLRRRAVAATAFSSGDNGGADDDTRRGASSSGGVVVVGAAAHPSLAAAHPQILPRRRIRDPRQSDFAGPSHAERSSKRQRYGSGGGGALPQQQQQQQQQYYYDEEEQQWAPPPPVDYRQQQQPMTMMMRPPFEEGGIPMTMYPPASDASAGSGASRSSANAATAYANPTQYYPGESLRRRIRGGRSFEAVWGSGGSHNSNFRQLGGDGGGKVGFGTNRSTATSPTPADYYSYDRHNPMQQQRYRYDYQQQRGGSRYQPSAPPQQPQPPYGYAEHVLPPPPPMGGYPVQPPLPPQPQRRGINLPRRSVGSGTAGYEEEDLQPDDWQDPGAYPTDMVQQQQPPPPPFGNYRPDDGNGTGPYASISRSTYDSASFPAFSDAEPAPPPLFDDTFEEDYPPQRGELAATGPEPRRPAGIQTFAGRPEQGSRQDPPPPPPPPPGNFGGASVGIPRFQAQADHQEEPRDRATSQRTRTQDPDHGGQQRPFDEISNITIGDDNDNRNAEASRFNNAVAEPKPKQQQQYRIPQPPPRRQQEPYLSGELHQQQAAARGRAGHQPVIASAAARRPPPGPPSNGGVQHPPSGRRRAERLGEPPPGAYAQDSPTESDFEIGKNFHPREPNPVFEAPPEIKFFRDGVQCNMRGQPLGIPKSAPVQQQRQHQGAGRNADDVYADHDDSDSLKDDDLQGRTSLWRK